MDTTNYCKFCAEGVVAMNGIHFPNTEGSIPCLAMSKDVNQDQGEGRKNSSAESEIEALGLGCKEPAAVPTESPRPALVKKTVSYQVTITVEAPPEHEDYLIDDLDEIETDLTIDWPAKWAPAVLYAWGRILHNVQITVLPSAGRGDNKTGAEGSLASPLPCGEFKDATEREEFYAWIKAGKPEITQQPESSSSVASSEGEKGRVLDDHCFYCRHRYDHTDDQHRNELIEYRVRQAANAAAEKIVVSPESDIRGGWSLNEIAGIISAEFTYLYDTSSHSSSSVSSEDEKPRDHNCHDHMDEYCSICIQWQLVGKNLPIPSGQREVWEQIAAKIIPDCLSRSRTCFIKDCGYEKCWGCDDAKAERKRVADIIAAELSATPAPVGSERRSILSEAMRIANHCVQSHDHAPQGNVEGEIIKKGTSPAECVYLELKKTRDAAEQVFIFVR